MRPREVYNGRFEIERLAGSGGMGTVFRANDRLTGAPVALKVVNAGHSPEVAERFQRETALLAELHHPGIVRFVASGVTPDGQAYLVMEWLEGESLVERLARGTLSVEEAVDLGRRVATALSVAHARGVVHRDLKPANLFLPERDLARVMILDFGIARVVEDGRSLTSTGSTLGSPGYLSPEQARGSKSLDTRADVFSLACVIFRCLTGRPPFTGDLIQAMMQTVMEPAPLAGSLREGIPPALEDLLQRMLSKSPDGRPRDAAAVAAELAALAAPPLAAAPQATTAHGTVALPMMMEPPSPVASRQVPSSPPARPAPSSTPPPSLASARAPSPALLTAPFSLVSPPSAASARPTSSPPSAPPAGPPSARPPRTFHDEGAAPPVSVRSPASGPASTLAPYAQAPASPPPAPRRSRAWTWVIAGMAVLFVAAGAAAFFLDDGFGLLDHARPPAPAARRKAR